MKWYGGKIGDIRVKRRFAIFPNKMNNGEWIWFETYYSVQIYNEWIHPDSGTCYTGWLTRHKFLNEVSLEEVKKLSK